MASTKQHCSHEKEDDEPASPTAALSEHLSTSPSTDGDLLLDSSCLDHPACLRTASGLRVLLQELIGDGSSKRVHLALLASEAGAGAREEPCWQRVAVAFNCEGGGMEAWERALLQDVGLAGHPHLLHVEEHGVDEAGNGFMVTGLMQLGSLYEILQTPQGMSLGLGTRLELCRQVCEGMKALAGVGVVHRDLSARNVLVSSLEPAVHAKVCDFDMAWRVDPATGQAAAPRSVSTSTPRATKVAVRWCPPEVLCAAVPHWSEKSDVWSFGVTMWEIFSNGAEPYAVLSNDQVPVAVQQGLHLARPPSCPRHVYDIMLSCWRTSPDARPTFAQLCDELHCVYNAPPMPPSAGYDRSAPSCPPNSPSCGSSHMPGLRAMPYVMCSSMRLGFWSPPTLSSPAARLSGQVLQLPTFEPPPGLQHAPTTPG